jgi:hypothetical protein
VFAAAIALASLLALLAAPAGRSVLERKRSSRKITRGEMNALAFLF